MKRFIMAALLLFVFTNSYAQELKDSLKLKLAPVTITATRYPESIHEIPYAVSILTVRDFLTARPFGFDEAVSNVPGVLAQSRSGSQDIRITIRGFGARGAGDRSNSGTSRGIRVMVDGIPETEPDGRTSFDMVETGLAEKIEVVRSNASAIWGNAAGGVINISTIPEFSGDFLNLGAGIGAFGTTKFIVKTGFSLTNGKVVVGFANNHMNGWREHSESHRTIASVGFISDLSPKSKLGVYIMASRAKFQIPGPLSLSQYNSDAKMANVDYQGRDERRFNRIGRIGVTLDHSFNGVHGLSAMAFVSPKFLQRSERGTFRDFNRYHVGGNAMYHNTLHFAEATNKFVAGFDEAYQDGAIQFYSLSATNGRGNALNDNKREGANTFGAFFQNELLLEHFSVLFGGRYDKVTYYSDAYPVSSTSSVQSDEKAFEKFTPKVGVTYFLNEHINIYANLGGGIEVPAGNETDASTGTNLISPLLEPIQSTTYELGVKSLAYEFNSLVKTFSFDVAAYLIKVKNDIQPYKDGKYYQTVGKQTRQGIELQAAVGWAYGLKVIDMVTYSQNKYDDYVLTKAITGVDAVYDGNKTAGLPEFSNALNLSYKPEFFNKLNATLQVKTLGKYFADDANTLEVPAYTVLNASLMYEDVLPVGNTGVRAALSVYNLTDKKYVASAFINPIKYTVAGSAKELGFIEPGLPMNAAFSLTLLF